MNRRPLPFPLQVALLWGVLFVFAAGAFLVLSRMDWPVEFAEVGP